MEGKGRVGGEGEGKERVGGEGEGDWDRWLVPEASRYPVISLLISFPPSSLSPFSPLLPPFSFFFSFHAHHLPLALYSSLCPFSS